MNLDQLQIVARPRTPWQAMDLGCKIAVKHWFPLFLGWLFMALPVFFIASAVVPSEWVILILWWFKPLYERWQLYYLSLAMFNEAPPLNHIYKRFFRYAMPQIIWQLSIRRFSFSRSFNIAVAMLEQLKGEPRRKRISLLERGEPTFWLATILVHIETFLYFAFFSVVIMFVPSMDFEWEVFLDQNLANFIWLCAMAFIAPFFSACGFVMYLNRRMNLEGWDLQINFQRLLNRLTLPLCLIIFGFSTAMMPTQSYADEHFSPQDSQDTLDELYKGPPIHRTEEIRVPNFAADWDIFHPDRNKDDSDFNGYDTDLSVFGSVIEVFLWLGLILVIGFLVYYLVKNYSKGLSLSLPKKIQKAAIRPKTLFGLDVSEESLPDDIIAAVKKLAQEGQWREAVGLLYRASLIRTMAHESVNFRNGFTESDCLEAVHTLNNVQLSEFFILLNKYWILVAWAHRDMSLEQLDGVIDLWQQLEQVSDGDGLAQEASNVPLVSNNKGAKAVEHPNVASKKGADHE